MEGKFLRSFEVCGLDLGTLKERLKLEVKISSTSYKIKITVKKNNKTTTTKFHRFTKVRKGWEGLCPCLQTSSCTSANSVRRGCHLINERCESIIAPGNISCVTDQFLSRISTIHIMKRLNYVYYTYCF